MTLFRPDFRDGSANFIAGVGLTILVILICIFFADAIESRPGEMVGAVAAIVGGALGASGSALAVYLTLRGQREEDSARVSAALRREVVEFARLAVGHLENSIEIATNANMKVPIRALPAAMEMPDPIIYRAIADRLSLATSPLLVVAFYTRLNEIKTALVVLASGPRRDEIACASDVALIAQTWIDVLNFALRIITNTSTDRDFDSTVDQAVVQDAKRVVESGQMTFSDVIVQAKN